MEILLRHEVTELFEPARAIEEMNEWANERLEDQRDLLILGVEVQLGNQRVAQQGRKGSHASLDHLAIGMWLIVLRAQFLVLLPEVLGHEVDLEGVREHWIVGLGVSQEDLAQRQLRKGLAT